MKKMSWHRKQIRASVECRLWGRAAGRCEMGSCNKPLWRSPLTAHGMNLAEKAHIIPIHDGGERGDEYIAPEHRDELENLMLVCHTCHEEIDEKKKGGKRFPADTLRANKRAHEARVERVTAIDITKKSQVILYGAAIGEHSSPLSRARAEVAMMPERYPANDQPILLGMVNTASRDREEAYWTGELENLKKLFAIRLRDRISEPGLEHLSVFGLAPQPLLTALGVMLTDIAWADVYQLRREPPGWGFDAQGEPLSIQVAAPRHHSGPAALVLSISATVADDRIYRVLGDHASIWRVVVPSPNNDVVRLRSHLSEFRQVMRVVLDRIKAAHGHDALLHVFPALPVSLAVELGRVRMPKADMRWRIHDELPGRGFVAVVDVEGCNVNAVCAAKEIA